MIPRAGLQPLLATTSLLVSVWLVSCARETGSNRARPSTSAAVSSAEAFALDSSPPFASAARPGLPIASASPFDPAPTLGQPRRGMVFIEGGALVAGSSPDIIPRRPDREPAGEQVILRGFYIDIFAYPNEQGAIPLANVSQPQASNLCEKEGKRLCTELEWERACKGPLNNTYSWGNDYRPEVCRTGSAITGRPAGLLVGCRSAFGMRDTHGGLFEWTMSRWQRPGNESDVAVRGGNGTFGNLFARCANVESRSPKQRSPEVGFRCCAGPVNAAEVVLDRRPAEPLTRVERIDRAMVDRLATRLPPDAFKDLGTKQVDAVMRFVWYPVPNERIELLMVCGRAHYPRFCGLMVARETAGQPAVLGWAATGYMASKIHRDHNARDLWLLGSDDYGQFKRLVRYAWGAVEVGPRERLISKRDRDEEDDDKP